MHGRRSLTAVVVIGSVLVVDIGVMGPRVAGAQVADGHKDTSSIGAKATTPSAAGSASAAKDTSAGPGRRPGRSGRPTCRYVAVPVEAAVFMNIFKPGWADPLANLPSEGSNVAADGKRSFYKECEGAAGQFVYLPPRRAGAGPGLAPPPTPGELAEEAAQQTVLPAPSVGLSPAPPVMQLVNLPVFLWIDAGQWVPQSASASAGGVTSTVTATPRRVVWDMGNGDSVVCEGPGVPYVPRVPDEEQNADCSYTYRRSSAREPDEAFTITTTLEWDVAWVAVGAPGGGSLGTARRSTSTVVQVGEIQVLNVPVTR